MKVILLIVLWGCTLQAASLKIQADLLESSRELSSASQTLLREKFTGYSIYRLPGEMNLQALPEGNFQLSLSLGSQKSWQLNLQERNLLSPDYLVRSGTSMGKKVIPSQAPRTYIARSSDGLTRGRLSFDGISVTGLLIENGKMIFMEPLSRMDNTADPDFLVSYSVQDVISGDTRCGVSDTYDESSGPLPEAMKKYAPSSGKAACARTQIAFAVDNSMLRQYGSTGAAENRIIEVMNGVEELYALPEVDIKYTITEMYFEETDEDTWGPQNSFNTNLSELLDWAPSSQGFVNEYDVASMWFYERGGGTVGMAMVGAICSESRGGNVVKDFSSRYMSMVVDQAHELGHNWDAPHVNGSTYIMNPTIIREDPEWANSTLNRMADHKDSRNCLSGCDVPPVADFAYQNISCRSTVNFTDRSVNDPAVWQWSFGDGNQSTEQDPVHTYSSNGTYSVTLISSNAFGEDVVTKQGVIEIDAPDAPTVATPQCIDNEITLSAQSSGVVKWYTEPQGGVPFVTRNTLTIPVPAEPSTYYVESGDPDGSLQNFGPTNHLDGEGDYKDNGSVQIYFDVIAPVRLVGFRVISDMSGERHFILSLDGSVVHDTVMQLSQGTHDLEFNWDLYNLGEYELELEQAGDYINNLYRNTAGVEYPQRIDNLISVNRNYYHSTDQSSTGWYIGYDWQVQSLGACASPRVAIEVQPTCITAVDDYGLNKYVGSNIASLGRLLHLEVRDIQGKNIISLAPGQTRTNLSAMLELLPKGRVYWINLQGVRGSLSRKWLSL